MACVLTDPRSVLALPTDLLRWWTRVRAFRVLFGNNLNGTIPEGISNLTALTQLCVWLHPLRTRQQHAFALRSGFVAVQLRGVRDVGGTQPAVVMPGGDGADGSTQRACAPRSPVAVAGACACLQATSRKHS